MGCFLISFCLGNTRFPVGDGLARHINALGEVLLTESQFLSILLDVFCKFHVFASPFTFDDRSTAKNEPPKAFVMHPFGLSKAFDSRL